MHYKSILNILKEHNNCNVYFVALGCNEQRHDHLVFDDATYFF